MMGNWIVAPGEVHEHDMPEGEYERDTVWLCACGQRFRHTPDYITHWHKDNEVKFNNSTKVWI